MCVPAPYFSLSFQSRPVSSPTFLIPSLPPPEEGRTWTLNPRGGDEGFPTLFLFPALKVSSCGPSLTSASLKCTKLGFGPTSNLTDTNALLLSTSMNCLSASTTFLLLLSFMPSYTTSINFCFSCKIASNFSARMMLSQAPLEWRVCLENPRVCWAATYLCRQHPVRFPPVILHTTSGTASCSWIDPRSEIRDRKETAIWAQVRQRHGACTVRRGDCSTLADKTCLLLLLLHLRVHVDSSLVTPLSQRSTIVVSLSTVSRRQDFPQSSHS